MVHFYRIIIYIVSNNLIKYLFLIVLNFYFFPMCTHVFKILVACKFYFPV